MAVSKLNPSAGGVPYGDNSKRPANPEIGRLFSNGEVGRLELYTSSGWQNIVQETPGVASATGSYLESTNSGTFVIGGTNFVSGAIAYAIGTDGVPHEATTTTYNSLVQLTALFENLSASYEPYDIKVLNPSNLFGLLPDAFYINQSAVWSTSAGSLGSSYEESSVSISLSASDPENSTVTFAITSGSLPVGLSLNSSTGVISGTLSTVSADTTYTFTVNASDGANLSSRTFNYTVLNMLAPSTVEALVIAGGGGGGGDVGAGGGAGGLIYHASFAITAGNSYIVTVGAGGVAGSQVSGGENGTAGQDSYFGSLRAFGGGRGGFWMNGNGFDGGSGGGASNNYSASGGASIQTSNNGGTGYGNAGGGSNSASYASGGGGGAGAAGAANSGTQGGAGGIGLNTWATWATSTSSGHLGYFAGGGGGGGGTDGGGDSPGNGGLGGGGRGWRRAPGTATAGTANTGGGGGGTAGGSSTGGAGGSGIVIIRYPITSTDPVSVTNATKYTAGGYKYYKFNSTGSITF